LRSFHRSRVTGYTFTRASSRLLSTAAYGRRNFACRLRTRPVLKGNSRHVKLVAAYCGFGLFWGTWAAIIPDVKTAIRGNDAELGAALLGAGLGALPAMAFAGRLFDRFGQRSLQVTLGVFALTIPLPALATSPIALFAWLLVLGAAGGVLDVVMNASVAEEESVTGRRLMQAAHAGFSGVFLLGSLATGAARAAGAAHAVPLIATAAIVAFIAALNRSTPSRPRAPRAGRRPPLDRALVVLGAICLLVFVVEGSMEAWSALHLERTFGTGESVGALGPGLFALAMVTGRTVAQVFLQRLGDEQLLLAGGVTAAAGAVAASAAPAPWIALAGFVVTGFGASVGAPTLFALAGRASPVQGAAVGTVVTVGYIGFLIGPPMVGWISEATNLRVGFVFLAATAASFGLAGSAFVRRRFPEQAMTD
jgi:MFS family permease